jgi:hypothetical protein
MQTGPRLEMSVAKGWERVFSRVRVVKLSPPLMLIVPSLALASIQKRTRGFSFFPGLSGAVAGAALLVGSLVIALIVFGPLGPPGALVSFWLLGTTGAVMMVSGARPMAFVKPICMKCRLLPVIKEHESIHLSGVPGEAEVWESMRTRHSVRSLSLEGDPAICSFCPIPKRLAGK